VIIFDSKPKDRYFIQRMSLFEKKIRAYSYIDHLFKQTGCCSKGLNKRKTELI
jgi:hypothetical protein